MGSNNVTLDKRDLFDAVRSAIKYAMLEQGSREDDAELYADATDRTEKCLADLYASDPVSCYTAGQMLKCVAIPKLHEGYFTVGDQYEISEVDHEDVGLSLDMYCDLGFTLWCEASAFVAV